MQTESFTLGLCVASLFLIVKAFECRKLSIYLAAGVVAGIAALFRLNTLTLPLAAGLVGVASLIRRQPFKERRQLFLGLLVYTITVVAVIIPTSILNSRNAGQPVLVAGSNGERLMLGANYNTRGEWVAAQPVPPEWQAAIDAVPNKERDKVARAIVKDFMVDSHPVYYWFTIFPNKFWELLWADHWVYVGQHRGNSMELPFGPFLRLPLFTSGFIVFLGLLGLFYRTQVTPRILLVNVLLQLWSIQALIIEARYRLIVECLLIVPVGAVLHRLYFQFNTTERLKRALYVYASVAIVWSFTNVIRFGGPNLASATVGQFPILNQMVASEFALTKSDMAPKRIDIGGFPVDAGHCSHLNASFKYKLERPADKAEDYDTYSASWPKISMVYSQFDDRMSTITSDFSMQNAPELSAFQTSGGEQWRVIELHGRTKFVRVSLLIENAGTVYISDLKARGPVWCRPF